MHARQDDGPPRDDRLAMRLTETAVSALQRSRPAEALPSLDRLRLLPGRSGTAAALRAEALLALGRPEEAELASVEALEDRPEDPARLELRARSLHACGRRLDALDAAAAAVIAGPAGLSAMMLFAVLLIEERRFEDAIAVLEDARRRAPEDPHVALRLGLACMRAGRHAEAEALLAALHARMPGFAGLPAMRAQAALARGEAELAAERAREGLARVGPDAALSSVLGHALEKAGRRDEAFAAFRAAARLAPEDPYLAHLVAAADGEATERAGAGYVESVFDGYAPRFEESLISLGYRVPGLVGRAVERHRPAAAAGTAKLGPVLDLGCGTGLVGVALMDMLGGPLVGVDLSRRMLAEAGAKGLYTALRQEDLLALLAEPGDLYDLVIAADVFCYLGRLDRVLTLAAGRLAPQGLLIFSVERAPDGTGFSLHRQGRYAHARDLVEADLAAAGLRIVELREEVLRHDLGRPVEGLFVVAGQA